MAGQETSCPVCQHSFQIPPDGSGPSAVPTRSARPSRGRIGLLAFAGLVVLAAAVFAVFSKRTRLVPGRIASAPVRPAAFTFGHDVAPLLNEYCFGCHGNGKKKGDLALDVYKDESAVLHDRKTWEKVMHHLQSGEMPPENKPQPTREQRDRLVSWIDSTIFKVDCDHPDPGRVTLRRLNRVEYNNTIRDLVGVNFQPADDFPADDSGYGFDNIGDVLSLPPVLLEKYLAAAEKILAAAIVTDPVRAATVRMDGTKMEPEAGKSVLPNRARGLYGNGEVHVKYRAPKEGDYQLRIKAYGQQAGPDPARMQLRLNNATVKTFDVSAVEDAPRYYEFKAHFKAGEQRVAMAFINDYMTPPEPKKTQKDRNLFILSVDIAPPADAFPLPDSHLRLVGHLLQSEKNADSAKKIVQRFAGRAYRRPVSEAEVERLMRLFEMANKNGESFERAVQLTLQAVLVSPYFLFRGELQPEPNNPNMVHPINEYSLASRLSYFLWSSMPDETLFGEAEQGTLRNNLDAEVKRMLNDPKATALVDNFAGQWLQIRNLKLMSPDPDEFPEFDDDLRQAMERETELLFETILREDRSVLDFLAADYTFVNERLAKHYKIQGVKGTEFQKVSLKGTHRRGLLTQGSVLTITSNPTRTSPVKRGKWVLENILGTPPPPPPPEVPELSEAKEKVLSGTLRQRMEQHREDPICASCHARMDPIGFGLENFDGVGGWREKDGKFAVDPAGKLVSGETFKGPAELIDILMQRKRDEFVRCLAEKMLTYALGRGIEYYDRCAVDQMVRGTAKNGYKFSSLILELVKSTPFQKRRGEGDRFLQASR